MKDEIVKLLLECHPKGRTRVIKNSEPIYAWITEHYPNVPLNIVADCLVKNTSPYCCVCNCPIKSLGKKTCSTKCRSVSLLNKVSTIVEKRKKTNIEKYGSTSPSGSPAVVKKRLDTMIEKYGANVSPKTIESAKARIAGLNEKGRKTFQEKYGVSNPGQMVDHRKKCVETLKKNYGVDHYYKSQKFKNTVIEKNLKKWNTVLPDCVTLIDVTDNIEKQQLFENPNKEIKFKCNTCGNTDCVPSETVKWRIKNSGTPCITCSGINVGSLKQCEVGDFIKSLGIKIISNYKLPDKTEIDIFCPEYNIGFEFDGLYWHNDLRIPKSYHLDKTLEAKKCGIKLIHIFEDEWDYKQCIVKSRIKNLLGVTTDKIFAKRCIIKSVSKFEENQFLNDNHIQGFSRSSIAYGLYLNDKLVSIMSFGKPSKAKGQKNIPGHWELLRFCSLIDTNVVGGAGRLLQAFIKNHTPTQILSFADKRWSTGHLYKMLGFSEEHQTSINYWYIKNNQRFHRFGLRKNKNDNQTLTEYENRLSQGYLRIWDCGSSKWIWNAK